MNIKNYYDLFLSPDLSNGQLYLRKIGFEALEIAIESVRPKKLIEQAVKIDHRNLIIQNDIYDLQLFRKIYIIGGGKATAEMAYFITLLLDLVPNVTYRGIINIQEGLNIEPFNFEDKFQINRASHPIPNITGLKGTKSMINLIKEATKDDLIICLISGGGSALLPLPRKEISLQDLKHLNSLLLDSGVSIHEINTIRKHISDFKGGNLAKTVFKTSNATLVSLIISDVIGNNLDSIASGPTVPDSTTFKDAVEILKKYKLFDLISPRIKEVLKEGLKNSEEENPKEGDFCFKKVHNYLIGSIDNAAHEILKYLREKSYHVEFFSNEIRGEARDFSKELDKIITKKVKDLNKKGFNNKEALIGTGELTVTIKGEGIGGRNQEMLLNYIEIIKKKNLNYNFLVIAVNLDGIEGNSSAMGALIDNHFVDQLKIKRLDPFSYLKNNDSNTFFHIMGTEIITGPTGCNVNDIIIILLQT
jgi:glycerate 2-kinase